MSTPFSDTKARLAKLRTLFSEAVVDGLVVTKRHNIQYLSGFTGSAAHLLITQTDAILITDARYTIAAGQEAPDFTIVTSTGSGGYIEALGIETEKLTALSRLGFEKNDVTYGQWESWTAAMPSSIILVPTADLVEKLRQIKSAAEIAAIQRAIAIAQEAFLSVQYKLTAGTRERDFAFALENAMRERGASAPSFESIVASGPQGARPHHHPNDRAFVDGDLVTIDWGALVDGYCSDITRTVLIGSVGESTIEQEKVHALVLKAQQLAIAAIGPGKTGKEIDASARDFLTEHGYGAAFSHSLGHSLGLDVHDGPGFSTKSDLILQPGMVLTVEPGVYLADWGGVRIEEDIVVTDTGCQVLTSLPQTITLHP